MSAIGPRLGVDEQVYLALLEASDHRCWICGNPEGVPGRRLAIDHDHRTGQVRGLLCTSCNRRLGGTVDPEWLRRAAEYIELAAAAHGDLCDSCEQPAPWRLVSTDSSGGSIYQHECCERRWTVSYTTRGIPLEWRATGEIPTVQREPLSDRPLYGAHRTRSAR